MKTKKFNPELLVDSHHGIYIPQFFCKWYGNYITNINEVIEELTIVEKGPKKEKYWKAWDDLLNKMKFKNDDGIECTVIYNNEDLWAIPVDQEIPEDWFI